jgi:mono/diheme cytochrome c family protein
MRRVGLPVTNWSSRWCASALLAGAVALPEIVLGQRPATGAEMYAAWCAVCHADDGTGQNAQRPMAQPPMDFADCTVATGEPDVDWDLVISAGGPAAGLSSDMPSFEALSVVEIRQLTAHLRTFCTEQGWPSGNLSVRRAVFTTKAFPEYEAVLVPMVSHGDSSYTRVRLKAIYARRVGKRGQVEVALPAETVGWVTGTVGGVGDLSVGGKYVLHAGRERPWIAAAGFDVSLPTGSLRWEFGAGSVVAEPYLAAAFVWQRMTVQADVRGRYFSRQIEGEAYQHLMYNASLSRDWSTTPTGWTTGVEVSGVGSGIGLVPYVAKGLTRSGSLTAAVGVRFPVSAPSPYVTDLTPLRARR